jgi:ABC-type thiamin/hydroxymethylpyrimidine transport system permease subunit
MIKGWTTTRLITAGSLGVFSFVLQLPASAITATTGVPLTGGFINVFIGPAMDSLTPLVVPVFGAATIQRIVLGLLAFPIALAGPPGFFPKVALFLIQGLIVDFVFMILRTRKKSAAIIASAVSAVYLIFALVFIGKLFSIPGIAQTARIFLSPLLLIGTLAAGGVSGFLAWFIYQRIKNTAIIRRIQA